MAKKRKTRQQKIIADLRHNFNHPLVNQSSSEAKIKLQTATISQSVQKAQKTTTANEYPFLVKDLTKTGVLTVSILAFQVALFFLLKNHTLIIPGLNY